MSCIVRTRTRVAGAASRIRSIALMPLDPGMLMSTSATSGRSVVALRTASSPSLASPTTSRSRWLLMSMRSPLRRTAWSSPGIIRILPIGASENRYPDVDGGALTRYRFDRHGAAEQGGALPHAVEPQLRPGRRRAQGGLDVEAAAV